MPLIRRIAAILFFLLLTVVAAAAGNLWNIGAFSFSDELGGFRIVGVSGAGTRDDPIMVKQELYSASEMVLTIRVSAPEGLRHNRGYAGLALYLGLINMNASDLAWVEFGFELQQDLGNPSTYGDGLSFDQAVGELDGIGSNAFKSFLRDFEPYDRILFREGKVDPREEVTFVMLITDLTPAHQFHIVQDPRIPFS